MTTLPTHLRDEGGALRQSGETRGQHIGGDESVDGLQQVFVEVPDLSGRSRVQKSGRLLDSVTKSEDTKYGRVREGRVGPGGGVMTRDSGKGDLHGVGGDDGPADKPCYGNVSCYIR